MHQPFALFALIAALPTCAPRTPEEELAATVVSGAGTELDAAEAAGAPDIPALRPGELTALPTTGSGLQAVYAAPQGEEVDPSQVAVVFDRPMVALADLEQAVPLSCTPAIEGRARWAGTSTAVIVPEGYEMKAATQYTCKVPKGTAAADGTALEHDVTWTFATKRPALKRSWPREGADDWKPEDPIVLRFNQDVDPATIGRSLRLETGDGKVVSTSVARATGDKGQPDTVEVRAKLQRQTAYNLVLAEGLRGAEGPLPSSGVATVSFSTFPDVQITRAAPEGDKVDPEDSLTIAFTTPVPAKEVNEHLSIAPPPPDGWKPAEAYSSRYWYYSPRLKPRTTYTVTLTAGVKDDYGQVLKDGKTWSFTTGDLRPMVDAPGSSDDIYPATNPAQLPIRFRNVSRVDVGVERLDPMEILLKGQAWDGWQEAKATARVDQRVLAEDKPNYIQVGLVDLAPALTGGFGLLRMSSTAPEDIGYDDVPQVWRSFLQVTDLGATLKLSPDGALVWVTRLSDGSPVADAEVILGHDHKVVWQGKTGADGTALAIGDLVPDSWSAWSDDVGVLVRSGDDASLTWHSWRDGFWGYDHGVDDSFDARQETVQIELFTDRGVYRAGDTVHVQAVARTKSRAALKSPGGRALTWELHGPEGETLASGTGKLDDKGAFSFDVKPAADGPNGDYSVRVAIGDDTGYAGVAVRAYRAPVFRVDVASAPQLVVGDTLKASVQARYLFGAPMKDERVQWSVRRVPLEVAPPQWETFSFAAIPSEELWYAPEPYEQSVSNGEGKLGKDGSFSFTQALGDGDVTHPWTYIAEATVTDTDRQQVSNRVGVPVHSAQVYPGVHVKDWVATLGSPVKVEVTAVKADLSTAAGQSVKVTALKRSWDSIQERGMDGLYHWVSTPKDEPVGSGQVTVGTSATPWSFSPTSAGYHLIRVETTDSKGHKAIAEADVYVVGGDVAWARGDGKKLDMVPDKARYAPGDTARILVKTPKPGMTALVTVEREGIYSRSIVTLKSTADTIPVPITAEMMPNAFVSVTIAEGAPPATQIGAGLPQVWFGETRLLVDTSSQVADVKVGTDREAYQPGESVQISVAAQRGGQPLADARVTLWAVDYGVLSLTAYQTPDLHDLFYTLRPLGVITADTRQSVYDRGAHLAKGAPIGGGGGYDADVRTKFETTPLWAPNLRTGKDGQLAYTLKLPDNLTTFRIMAVVDDGAGAFGKGEHEIRVNRPLIARPALPRFFRDGDRAFAGVVVHNNTEAPAEVKVEGTVDGATLTGAPRTVTVEAGAAKEVPFALADFTKDRVHFRFDATGGGNHDAVEVEVPVSALAVNEVVASAGSTTTEAKETVAIPAGAVPGQGGLGVDVSASALVGMGSSLDYLVDYPHGCIEQAGSRIRVALLAKHLGPRAGLTTPPEKLEEIIRVGLEKLHTYRVPGGGMAYWPGGNEVSGPATAYALEVYSTAKVAGYKVDAGEIDELVRVTRQFLGGSYIPSWWTPELTRAAQARAALSLARAGSGDAAFNQTLYADAKQLPQHMRAGLVEALARTTGADARTAALTRELEAAAHVEATSAALEDKQGGLWQALWYGDDLDTTAFVRGLLASNPKHPLLPRFVQHLVGARQHGRWANTYSTAEALAALADYVDRFEKGSVSTTVSLAGAALLQGDLGLGGTGTAQVGMAALKPGELLIQSTNGGRVYYETRLAYAAPEAPARDEGFTLVRSLAVVEGTGAGNVVTPGAMVRVTLRVVTPMDRYNVALVDPLPAGLEPVDSFFATTRADIPEEQEGGNDTAGGETPQWWSTWIFDRRDLRDDEARFYATWMPAGIHTISYLARATTPGEYTQPGARVEEMYAPEVYGRTDARHFVVGMPVAAR